MNHARCRQFPLTLTISLLLTACVGLAIPPAAPATFVVAIPTSAATSTPTPIPPPTQTPTLTVT
ncbi:MAG: hypothetical protein AAB217_17325, partial [Chloroflexota bacterium]